jgi:DNA-binding transcriptional LysR family regulator
MNHHDLRHLSPESMGGTFTKGARFRIDPALEHLKVVLPEWSAGDAPIYIVYPARRLVPARLTAFVRYLIAEVEAGRMPPFPGIK